MNIKTIKGQLFGFGRSEFTPVDKPEQHFVSTWICVAIPQDGTTGCGVDCVRYSISDRAWLGLGNSTPLWDTLANKNALNASVEVGVIYDNTLKKWQLLSFKIVPHNDNVPF